MIAVALVIAAKVMWALWALFLIGMGGVLAVRIGIPDLLGWAWRKSGAAGRLERRQARREAGREQSERGR